MSWLAWALVHALLCAAVLLLLATAWQNRDLRARLVATGRAPRQVLLRALRLWSPLAVAIVVFVGLAHALGLMAREATYRATPFDAWCTIEGADPAAAFPCTGLEPEQARGDLRPSPQSVRVERLVLDRYLAAIGSVADRPLSDFERIDAVASLQDLSPAAILSLPPSPEDDAELLRMRRELREVLATPVVPARNVMDVLRARADAEIRTRRLRELTAQVNARREQLAQRAYGGRPRAEQARLWWQHWIRRPLMAGAASPTALGRRLAEVAPAARPAALRDGMLSALAQDAAWSVERLAAADQDRRTRGGVSLALDLPRLCVFAAEPGQAFECPGRLPDGERLRLRGLDTAESARRSIERWHAANLRAGLQQLGATGLAARRGLLRVADAGRAFDRELTARLSLHREPCGIGRPAGCVGNAVRAGMEDAIRGSAAGPLERVRASVAAAEGRTAATLDRQLADAVSALRTRLALARTQALDATDRALALHRRLVTASWLFVAFLALKSFLYVLGLEAFRHRGPATLGFDDVAPIAGEWRIGRRLTLDPAFDGPLTTRRQLSNSDNRLRLAPWPGSAPVVRLLRGRYLFYTRGQFLGTGTDASGQGRVASADAGRAIVEWRMRPGEQVVFGWKDFFGASDNLRFRTRLSLRLSTLLLGRIVFRIAHAPADAEGRLLLKADVEQMDPADLQALPPERLLAWNPQVRFRAHGADTPWGILVHGYTLVRDPAVAGLVLTRSDEGGPRFGSLRFVRRLFTAVF